jgi:hypothetical protein
MFWDSVVAGLKVLTYWQTYVAGLEYLAIFFIPMIVIGILMEKNERIGGAVGCLSMFFLPVLQVAALAVFVLTLAPIIFGFAGEAAWSFPWKVMTLAPGAFFKLVGVLVVAAIILAFIPILGRLQSLQTLVLGGIALMFVLGLLDSINPGFVKGRVDFVPGFWFSVGLLVIWRCHVVDRHDGRCAHSNGYRYGPRRFRPTHNVFQSLQYSALSRCLCTEHGWALK